MIPKILHFVWFGGNVPNYAWRVMNMYKRVNPEFSVNFVCEKNVKAAVHPDVEKCYELVEDKTTKYYRIFNAKHFKGTQHKDEVIFNTAFSDAFRFYLLDKYGGIYLDLDTWPVKPFDDRLMALDYFYVQWEWEKGNAHADVFFMGADGKTDIAPPSFHFQAQPKLLSVDYDFFDEPKGIKLSEKLKACSIGYGDMYYAGKDVYINHLNKKTINWYTKIHKVGSPPFDKSKMTESTRWIIPM